ncbi:TPA: EAL domain-containing protein [Pseudomonas aeruginosa]|uniref:EAL domain-containing protein n=1 Tax=Pseudomonas aeruginosa TaxID=287 RepID=UPI000FC426F4|nr:EAL domain-containing protein [Pseudomonas aeruginosa]RUI13617.1 EAL domain-containing protein [Pseudomonas aeruginosa]HBO4520302.1 EAL domain-containing protein [Pseudomonas aeruginosa]HBO6310302.1 EAL domain-containing protein [Pseudomonas aeruginosa]
MAAAIKPRHGLSQYLRERVEVVFSLALFSGLPVFMLALYLFLKSPSLKSQLKQALKNRSFKIHYQPIIDSRTGFCSGAEALLRWPQPDGSMVRPDVFIPLAEEAGLIGPITDLLIEMVAHEMREVLASNSKLHIAINLCAGNINTGRVLPVISRTLENTGIKPEQIWLEVSERSILDIESTCLFLEAARKRGHIVAIDDFGTGYSNLKYLHSLPIDVLKIDKSFVSSIGTESVSSIVVFHIINMAKSLKLTIVAEGIEAQLQADYLTAYGVELMQGWLYHKALPAEKFLDVVFAKSDCLTL